MVGNNAIFLPKFAYQKCDGSVYGKNRSWGWRCGLESKIPATQRENLTSDPWHPHGSQGKQYMHLDLRVVGAERRGFLELIY